MRTLPSFISISIFFLLPCAYAASPEASTVLKTLKLADNQAEFQDVTELESAVRGIRFSSVIILSVPGIDPTFFPLIIYTAPKGMINNSKYDALKSEFLTKTPEKRSDLGETMGFIFEGTDEAFVFLDSLKIASHRPAIQGVVAPLEPRTETGISILGTMDSTGMDFQIFLIGPSKKQADLYPEYKLYLESLTDFKKVGLEIYKAVNDTKLLSKSINLEKRIYKYPYGSRSGTEPESSTRVQTHNQLGTESDHEISNTKSSGLWLWLSGLLVLLVAWILTRAENR